MTAAMQCSCSSFLGYLYELFFRWPGSQKLKYGSSDEYEILERIGKGSFGIVHRAREKKTGRVVAMKEDIHGLTESTLREIDILRSLVGHPRIVEFRQVVLDEAEHAYVVMEYVQNDLKWAMARKGSTGVSFIVKEVQCLMRQLLQGVAFLHSKGIMHRDLTPSNILLGKDGRLKICDFGVSKRFHRGFDEPAVYRAGTLWYTAPELLIGEGTYYSCSIDMWSVGCIMAEMLLNQVLFDGYSETNQLQKIVHILGKQEHIPWPGLSQRLPMLSPQGLHLLSKLLTYNPEHRITADEALNHDWFLPRI